MRGEAGEGDGATGTAEVLARLNPLARIGVRALSAFHRWRWTAFSGGRYQIGSDFLCNGRLRLRGAGTIVIGDHVNAWARAEANVLETYGPEARIEIGDNVRLNGAGLQAATGITVGRDCILGSCTIVDTDHHAVGVTRRDAAARPETAPIVIEANVWVAGFASVLKGVRIGRDSVVGFGSVVSSDVPAGVVVAGNPARVVRALYEGETDSSKG